VLLAVEPKARQFEPFGFVGGVVKRRLVAVAVEWRSTHRAGTRCRDTGRARAPEFVDQARKWHRITRGLEDPVQGRDAFVTVLRYVPQSPLLAGITCSS
jgi:hypothetical protein